MSSRARVATYGSTALVIVAGAVCLAVLSDGTGEIVGSALIGAGLIIALGLAFFEVGLSEDRERARESKPQLGVRSGGSERAHDTRFERSRGHRGRLR